VCHVGFHEQRFTPSLFDQADCLMAAFVDVADDDGGAVPGEYPRGMIDRYPDLAGIVTAAGLPI